MNTRRFISFISFLFVLFLMATLLCSPLWAGERTVQLTIPGCDS